MPSKRCACVCARVFVVCVCLIHSQLEGGGAAGSFSQGEAEARGARLTPNPYLVREDTEIDGRGQAPSPAGRSCQKVGEREEGTQNEGKRSEGMHTHAQRGARARAHGAGAACARAQRTHGGGRRECLPPDHTTIINTAACVRACGGGGGEGGKGGRGRGERGAGEGGKTGTVQWNGGVLLLLTSCC